MESKTTDSNRPRILVVDDEPENLRTLVSFLEAVPNKYLIYQAQNGQVALKVAQKVQPNLIISDWQMPVMDGIALTNALKMDPDLADIPVVMCSGVMTDSHNLKHALDAGAVDFVRKPVDQVELMARLNSVLKLSNSYREIKRLNQMKDRIFSIISHDLKNPIGALGNILDLLVNYQSSLNETKRTSLLQSSLNQIGSIQETLENLLLWAQSQMKNTIQNPKYCAIEDHIFQNIKLLDGLLVKKNVII